jgi:hypothetical protein
MKQVDLKSLSWAQKLSLIEAYKPTDDQAIRVFGVSSEQFNTVKRLNKEGVFKPDVSFDVRPYEHFFSDKNPVTTIVTSPTTSKPTIATFTRDTLQSIGEKKRGRPGTKITTAFKNVPTTPVPVDEFARQHNVSIAVLRQSKRFDTNGQGKVHVRKRDSGELMIWREVG